MKFGLTSRQKSPQPPCITIEEPTEIRETSFNVVVNVEINNELNTPSTSTHTSSNYSHSSDKQYIEVPTRNSVRKKVRWENHRISEESITNLYPYSETTSTRVGLLNFLNRKEDKNVS